MKESDKRFWNNVYKDPRFSGVMDLVIAKIFADEISEEAIADLVKRTMRYIVAEINVAEFFLNDKKNFKANERVAFAVNKFFKDINHENFVWDYKRVRDEKIKKEV